MPLVSIIIPVYNVKPYLSQCLDSILAQEEGAWEAIVVDDGSTDGSSEICNEYANKDSRFRVFHKDNGGVSSARNLGLDQAQGEWIWFVDADDYITDGAVQILADASSQSCDTIFHGLIILYENGKTRIEKASEYISLDKDTFLMQNYCYQNGMILFSNKVINKGKLRFSSGIKMAEDLEFQFKYLLLCERPIRIDQNLYVYRQREGSAIANPHTHINNMNDCFSVGMNLATFVNERNIKEELWFTQRICKLLKSGLQSSERLSWEQASGLSDILGATISAFKKAGYNSIVDNTIRIAMFNIHLYILFLRIYYKTKWISRK